MRNIIMMKWKTITYAMASFLLGLYFEYEFNLHEIMERHHTLLEKLFTVFMVCFIIFCYALLFYALTRKGGIDKHGNK